MIVDLTERYEWQGRQIAWGRAGDGPAVVFCHGTPWSSVYWRRIVDALTDSYTVYLWDMPGYGRSSKQPNHPVDFGVRADALHALLRHWGLARPHVIAHDFGGAVSLRAHLVCGADYASLMLVDVVAIPPSGHRSSSSCRTIQVCSINSRATFTARSCGLTSAMQAASHCATKISTTWSSRGLKPKARLLSTDRSSTTTSAICGRNEERLATLTVPVHVVWGEQDAWIPVEHSRSPAPADPAFDTAHGAWQQSPDSLRRTRATDV